MSTFNNFINGEWVASATAAPNINPSDSSDVIGHYALTDEAQTEAASLALGQAGRKPA